MLTVACDFDIDNTRNKGMNFKNTLCTLELCGWRFYAKSVFLFNIFYDNLHFDFSILGFF